MPRKYWPCKPFSRNHEMALGHEIRPHRRLAEREIRMDRSVRLAQLQPASWAPTSAQLGSNLRWAKLPNLDPQMVGTSALLKQKTPVFTGSFHVFLLSMILRLKQWSPCCVSVGPNSVWSCRQRPSCGMLKHDLDAHVHHMASIWNPSGSLWAQLQPNSTLGPSWTKLGPFGGKSEPTGPSSAQVKVGSTLPFGPT